MSDGEYLPQMTMYQVIYNTGTDAKLDILDYYIISHSIKKLCKNEHYTEIKYENCSSCIGIVKIGLCTINDLCYLKLNKIHNRYDFKIEK